MIVHVLATGDRGAIGPVLVACGEAAIVEAVRAVGGEAVLTRPDHPSVRIASSKRCRKSIRRPL